MAFTSYSKKMKVLESQMGTTVPRLPEDVIEKVISFFPINEAVSHGLISKRFLNSWKLCRDLSYDINLQNLAQPSDIFSIINRVMDEHSGPVIQRLKLLLNPTERENLVIDWILKAIRKGVQELDLNFSAGLHPFEFPPHLFSGAHLHVLKVNYCDVSIQNFDGFRFLNTLAIEGVLVPRAFSKAIFANCLLLENFEIRNCTSEFQLVIDSRQLKNFRSLKVVNFANLVDLYVDAPSLQGFFYAGIICRIFLKPEMSHLVEAALCFTSRDTNLFPKDEHLINALRFTKDIKISCCLPSSYPGFPDSDLQSSSPQQGDIHLSLDGRRANLGQMALLNMYDTVCFLNNCPDVEKLHIDFGPFPMESGCLWKRFTWHLFTVSTGNFMFLNNVHFMNFKFFEPEMEMAKFIIENAKVLEHCIIVKAKDHQEAQNQADFLRWLAAENPKAKVYESNEYKPPL